MLAALLWLRLFALNGFTESAGQQPQQESTASRCTISVNVDEVLLPITVLDRKGRFVPGLQEKNFRIFEDRVPQKIQYFEHQDLPVTVGLVIDSSGSMGPKLPEVKAAALAFALSSNPKDEMFGVNFNEKVSFSLHGDTAFVDNADQLKEAFSGIRAIGKTALYDAIAVALEHLQKGHWEKKALIVVSDGGDNASHHTWDQVARMAEESKTVIYTIGLFDENDRDQNPQVLKNLAKMTGGAAFFPETLSDVVGTCEQIAKEIRNQYNLGYISTNRTMDGKYRKIRVTAIAPKRGTLAVRTRAGYLAGSENVKEPATRETVCVQ